ncbi:MAG: serine hydrolase [Clostridiales Family XIII bacterium]|jgi:D-alanyl-D-alanine carboxypeptidase (penicillin-binding protein 5/6)|nr:serine hydrolase [Clostridiales Family XIII bacterium]
MRGGAHKRKRNAGCAILALLCVLAAVLGVCSLSGERRAEAPSEGNRSASGAPRDSRPGRSASEGYRVPPDLSVGSANAILLRVANGEALFCKNSDARMYPASLSKMMTAIVALEHLEDLDERIVLQDKGDFYYIARASVAGYLPGEEVRAIDLLYGLLLPSGAECAIGLAERVAGDESAFADLMNDKARELGMRGTHFVNATGLHDDAHYSTARDMAVLLRYAIENDTFLEIFTSARYASPPTDMHADGIAYHSTLFAEIGDARFDGGAILGGKTGYTEQAGQCLASLAEKYGEKFILVTCGAPEGDETHKPRIDDAFAVYGAIEAAD